MIKNYYIILEVTRDASPDEIKSAYRRKAKELHPDHYGENREPFQSIQEAYAVLSDPTRRRAHDETLDQEQRRAIPIRHQAAEHRRHPQVEPLIPEEGPPDFEDISLSQSFRTYHPSFEELFDRLWNNFSLFGHPKAEERENLTVEIPLSSAQARRGGRVRIALPAQETCPTCGGRGWVGPFPCLRCDGGGVISGEFPVEVSYPAGISGNYITQLPLDQFGIHNFYLTVYFRVSDWE